ncbi:ABC transporter substrate-binding protein [Paractinoplanes ferrugineus]|uniref:Peptide ABC transporter substrate-binding protein n=1 Tax=Paractinoplanes ferrugineus TaxID=113564 RepID=A0A919J8Q3_9ACTN|nr:ABC transporter substrate-binding protein [Actinoplanes ferrugineus]GIE15103.1 peptide ABC transporter substrate-binding protein [Actinoplanes ferrugineus]
MARRFKVAVAATAAVAIGLSGCGSPSSKSDTGKADTGKISAQQAATDPNAKGPAEEAKDAKKGGTISIVAQTTPSTLDPTDTYYTDSNEIEKLTFRTPTQYDIRDGQPVLVPDLTDLGTVSADKLTWTFKMTSTFKYEDGTDVKVDDLAYAIKRSFAHDVYPNGPAYQLSYFKDGDKYKGPYADGDTYAGVETQGTDTLIIHLAKPFADLPFYMTFAMFTPIPKAKDTKQDYKNHPISTGPYMFDQYVAGTSLTLKKNPYWDAKTDPVRHQYADAWSFKWGGELVSLQQKVLNSAGDDANSLAYDEVDASLVPQLTGDKAKQLIKGESPCLYVLNIDTRKIPDINVRKAIAKAYPYDALSKANGNNDYTAEPASTFLPPGVPGHTKYTPFPDLTGTGAGDAAGAKKLLTDAGKLGFELSWYYDNTKPISQQISNIRADALTKAGFKVKAIGVTTADQRAKISDYDAPVNLAQGPRGWCSDWPTGSSWLPVMFESKAIAEGTAWGFLQDKTLDKKIEDVANLPTDQATGKWAGLDQEIMGQYVALPWYYTKMAVVSGTNIGGAVGDATVGMPFFPDLYLKS